MAEHAVQTFFLLSFFLLASVQSSSIIFALCESKSYAIAFPTLPWLGYSTALQMRSILKNLYYYHYEYHCLAAWLTDWRKKTWLICLAFASLSSWIYETIPMSVLAVQARKLKAKRNRRISFHLLSQLRDLTRFKLTYLANMTRILPVNILEQNFLHRTN